MALFENPLSSCLISKNVRVKIFFAAIPHV